MGGLRRFFGRFKFWGRKKKAKKQPAKKKTPLPKPEKKGKSFKEMDTAAIIDNAERIMAHEAYRVDKNDILKAHDFKVHLNHTREIIKFRIEGRNMMEKLQKFLGERMGYPTRLDKRGNLLEQGLYDVINQALRDKTKLKLLERYYTGESQWKHIRQKFMESPQ